MTEDKKLEKRFEKWLRKYILCNDCERKCPCVQLNAYCEEQVKQAYIAGAKENKIVETNKLLPKENEDYFFVYGSGHSEYNNANNNEWLSMLRKCLEKKEQGIDVIQQLEHRNCVDCSNHHSNIKLLKAKKIIKELVRVEYADFTNGDYSNELSKVLEQAEQFLKENE